MLFTLHFRCFRTVPNTEGSVNIFSINQYHVSNCHFWPLNKVSCDCLILFYHRLEGHQQPEVLPVDVGGGSGGGCIGGEIVENPSFLHSCPRTPGPLKTLP